MSTKAKGGDSDAAHIRLDQHAKEIQEIKGSLHALEAKVDTGFSSVFTRQDEMRVDFATRMGELTNSLADRVNSSSRPDMKLWFTAAALVLCVVGMIGSGYVRDLNRVERESVNDNATLKADVKDAMEHLSAELVRQQGKHDELVGQTLPGYVVHSELLRVYAGEIKILQDRVQVCESGG